MRQTSPSDERDAARIAVLCIEAVFSASEMTLFRVEPGSRAFDGESLIDYLKGLVKPIAIDAQRGGEGRLLLRITPTKPPTRGPDIDPNLPRDMGEHIRRQHGVDEGALILVKGENNACFIMRVAALSLWAQSYRVCVGSWTVSSYGADEAARALGAVAEVRIHGPGPGSVHFSYISLD